MDNVGAVRASEANKQHKQSSYTALAIQVFFETGTKFELFQFSVFGNKNTDLRMIEHAWSEWHKLHYLLWIDSQWLSVQVKVRPAGRVHFSISSEMCKSCRSTTQWACNLFVLSIQLNGYLIHRFRLSSSPHLPPAPCGAPLQQSWIGFGMELHIKCESSAWVGFLWSTHSGLPLRRSW